MPPPGPGYDDLGVLIVLESKSVKVVGKLIQTLIHPGFKHQASIFDH